MVKILFTSLVTLLASLNVSLASEPLKRHHDLAERSPHDINHIARVSLDLPSEIPLKPRTTLGLGRRDPRGAEYTLLGCFSQLSTDGINLLNYPVPWNKTTIQTCVESCYTAASEPYTFAGVIAGSECRCDNAMPELATEVEQLNCRSKCANGEEAWCGGEASYQVYHLSSSAPSGTISITETFGSTSQVPSPTGCPTIPSTLSVSADISYGYLGCYEDTKDILTRVLRGPSSTSFSMTPNSCASNCANLGYPYAGTENGEECFCGATVFSTSPSSQCTQACTGDSTLACGAPLRISVFSITNPSVLGALEPLPKSSSGEWSSAGCFIDDIYARVMGSMVSTIPASNISVDACTEACKASGYNFTGLEYGSECFCSNSAPPLRADAHDCDMPCPTGGGSCGGALRLDVYTSI